MKNKKFIFFDLDGTLTDPGIGITNSVMHALKYYNISVESRELLYPFIGPPLVDSFMKYYGFSQEEAIQVRMAFTERYQPIGWKENKPYDGIVEVLEALKEAGKLLGIATSKPTDLATRVLEHFDLIKYFPIICAAPTNGLGAEKAGRIQAAFEEAKNLGYEVKNPIMVGDTKFDVEGAHQCDIPCVGVSWGFAAEGEFEACNTEFVVDTMDELKEILMK